MTRNEGSNYKDLVGDAAIGEVIESLPVLENWTDLLPGITRRIISSKKDVDELFSGFTGLRAITYVADPELLLHLFDKYGYEYVEVLIGEKLSSQYKDAISQKEIDIIESLAELIESGNLRVFVPDRTTVHSKLFIMEGPDFTRIVQGSLNLQTSRSKNYVWVVDLPHEDSFLNAVMKDYEAHFQGCSAFMSDLVELFRQHPNIDRPQLIRTWLEEEPAEQAEMEVKALFQEATLRSLEAASQDQVTFTLQLPEAPRSRKQLEHFVKPLKPVKKEGELQLSTLDYLNRVEKAVNVPPMYVDLDKRQVILCIGGAVKILTEPLPEPSQVSKALDHIESYLDTVDLGEADNPDFVKASMLEALLYIFSAPFFHEYMRLRRRRVGIVDKRGPRFLYIYGPSRNGKTTFLRFALKLLTGEDVQPLSHGDFTKNRIRDIMNLATVFPLTFDDVVPSKRPAFEEVVKSYWERWWQPRYIQPQIILSSNDFKLKDWAKSRTKRVDFDVFFPPKEENVEKLAELLTARNPVFKWFSHRYIEYLLGSLADERQLGEDELQLARIVMKDLYDYAGRPLPGWFPQKPIEEIYDPGRQEWRDLFRLKNMTVRKERDRIIVDFPDDMMQREIREYVSYLPQTMKADQKGKTLIIQPPGEFEKWLGKVRLLGRRFRIFRSRR